MNKEFESNREEIVNRLEIGSRSAATEILESVGVPLSDVVTFGDSRFSRGVSQTYTVKPEERLSVRLKGSSTDGNFLMVKKEFETAALNHESSQLQLRLKIASTEDEIPSELKNAVIFLRDVLTLYLKNDACGNDAYDDKGVNIKGEVRFFSAFEDGLSEYEYVREYIISNDSDGSIVSEYIVTPPSLCNGVGLELCVRRIHKYRIMDEKECRLMDKMAAFIANFSEKYFDSFTNPYSENPILNWFKGYSDLL